MGRQREIQHFSPTGFEAVWGKYPRDPFIINFSNQNEPGLREAADRFFQRHFQLLAQNPLGEFAVDVIDTKGLNPNNYSKTNSGESFHTDGAYFYTDPPDLVGLLCLSPAASGGVSVLIAVEDLVSRIREGGDGGVATLLQQHYLFAFVGRNGEKGITLRHILSKGEEGAFEVSYFRQLVETGYQQANSTMSPQQIRALDAFDLAAGDKEIQIRHLLEPGQLLCFNNKRFLHGRTAFADSGTRKRHLIRYWARGHRPA